MGREIVKFNKYATPEQPNFIPLRTNNFDPVLYTNMYTPSEAHAYSLAIEYMKDKFFKSKFPDNYFKSEWVNVAHTMRDYANFNKQNVKKEKPLFSIIPTVEYDYDRENIDMYYAGADVFLKRSDWQRSFFKDYDHNIFLGMQMRVLRMNFTYKIRVNTRAEELDLFRRMELVFRIGGTQAETISVDFNIPYNLLINIAMMAGFKVKQSELAGEKVAEIVEPLKFLDYLNSHSDIPVTYKYRTINGHNEYFMRISNLYTHVSTKDKLDVDDGERVGQLENNFTITMQAYLKIPVPQFFVLYNEKPLPFLLKTGEANIPLYSVGQFDIPDVNDKGWEQIINTTYMLDEHEKQFDISPLFKTNKTEDIDSVIKFCMKNFISPSCFIDIWIYDESEGSYFKAPFEMDWEKMEVLLGLDYPKDHNLYIAIYVDKKYMNDTLISINNFYKSRISDTKADKN